MSSQRGSTASASSVVMDPEKEAPLNEEAHNHQTTAETTAETTAAQEDAKDKASDSDVDQADLEKAEAAPPNPWDPRNNPDGGRQAWLCALGSFCVLFCSFGWINCG